MAEIKILDKHTIDKIAAGEVVDRPSSVVKELVENAIDAKATAVTIEIKDGGTSLIRITDNGSGIEKEQIQNAFLRHSTSKLRQVEDLLTIQSLGFRGEALSSISAVSQMELITKTSQELTGVRYCIEGGTETVFEDIGAPNGTTFIVRNLFYNTPARKKFLKTNQTEAGYVNDLVERMALANCNVSFKFINNGQVRLNTSGNGNLKDVIYQIYGRDIATNLLEVKIDHEDLTVSGFIGKPLISRGNRNYENYYVNGRYIKSALLSKCIEDSYHGFMMQHKYPFCVLRLTIPGHLVDVNVHPAKMQMRFSKSDEIYELLTSGIIAALKGKELIPLVSPGSDSEKKVSNESSNSNTSTKEAATIQKNIKPAARVPEPFEVNRLNKIRQSIRKDSPYEPKYERAERPGKSEQPVRGEKAEQLVRDGNSYKIPSLPKHPAQIVVPSDAGTSQMAEAVQITDTNQMTDTDLMANKNQVSEARQLTIEDSILSSGKLLDPAMKKDHKIIGQLFDTYWLVEFQDKFYMIDQHAAHEKVLFERTMSAYKNKSFTTQYVSPPLILSLTMQEEQLLKKHLDAFTSIGFEIEHFGGKEYAVSGVPGDLYGINGQALMIEMLDTLSNLSGREAPSLVIEKVASLSCKAAVKGNQTLSRPEVEALIDELLLLENPYHCPHGRPVIVAMTKTEIEKKFKRII